MSISIKSISEILAETKSVNTFLLDAKKYFAHISQYKKPELLAEHIELVQNKFASLSQVHNLDTTLNVLIQDLLKTNFQNLNTFVIHNFIKKLFVNTIVFHDYGKINENFQAHPDKMNNPHFKQIESLLSTHHSALGAYLYIIKHINEIITDFPQEQQGFLICSTLGFSYTIFKHHAKYLKDKGDVKTKFTFSEKEIPFLKKYIQNYQFNISERISTLLFQHNLNFKKSNIEVQFEKLDKCLESFTFYSLVRLSFSLLTASDFLASGEYMNDLKIEDFGVLSKGRIHKMYEHIKQSDYLDEHKTKPNYNKTTYQALDKYGKLKNPKDLSGDNLNVLRQEMAIEVILNIRKHKDKSLFYLEAPTGGGKTNLSMLATVELLMTNENLNKVYYVFPFTTLITQTHKAIIETMGLHADEVTQLHSKAGFKTKEEDHDGNYGDNKLNYLDNLFVNFPFCLLSHVKFFDILKTNEKETNYLLHRLANSVVVIDELQSYNPSHWDKVIYFIRHYANYYNIKFILMSATLPKLDKLKIIKNEVQDFVYLLPDAKEDYFRNPNFAKRVSFKFEILSDKEIELPSLAHILFEKSKLYASKDFGKAKPEESVYTIIEFIFKKSATEFYHEVMKFQEKEKFFDDVFVLSGTILEHRRRHIINYLKDNENRKKKILLITTQVVEAGVDIDMDLGFKNISLIDSDEQLAGRINRNVNKKDCELYLFKINEPRVLYQKDKRYEITRKEIKKTDYEHILAQKDFDKLYDLVLQNIDKWNETPMAIGFKDYEDNIKNLNFKAANEEFQLIEQKNISVFVPLAISIENQNFSKNELEFLKTADITPNDEQKIEGAAVFDLYIALIENKRIDFIGKKISLKTLQGIMSKFIFSVFDDNKGNTRMKLISFADIEKVKTEEFQNKEEGTSYGFIYLARHYEVYDEVFGLDDSKFDSSENCIL